MPVSCRIAARSVFEGTVPVFVETPPRHGLRARRSRPAGRASRPGRRRAARPGRSRSRQVVGRRDVSELRHHATSLQVEQLAAAGELQQAAHLELAHARRREAHRRGDAGERGGLASAEPEAQLEDLAGPRREAGQGGVDGAVLGGGHDAGGVVATGRRPARPGA